MKKGILIITGVLILMGCSKGGSSGNPAPSDNNGSSNSNNNSNNTSNTTPAPAKASLSLPAQNAVCTTGTIVSNISSTITFTWSPSANTNNYDLSIKNLLTSAITTQQNITGTQTAVTLLRNTPYSWYVISKSAQTTTTTSSDVWIFYNAGPGTVTYSPFPAEITSPTYDQSVTAATGTVSLTWQGSSVNPGTIASYDVYFGPTTTPPLLQNVTNSFINNVSVTANTTYYWKVVTKDMIGNTSDSGLFLFKVN